MCDSEKIRDMKGNILGYCILAGMVAIAVSLGFMKTTTRTVTVKGLCEREVSADRVIWPIVFVEGGNSLTSLAASVNAKNNVVLKWLFDSGIPAGEITVAAPKVEDQRANGYSNRSFDYVMKSVITVCTSDIEKVIGLQARQFDLIGKGIAVGGNAWENPTIFEYTALNDIKPEMIKQATLNAREAAEQFAKDSGSRVGKIINATQGQFSISDRDANTPSIKIIRVVTSVKYQLK